MSGFRIHHVMTAPSVPGSLGLWPTDLIVRQAV
jgi:hypothetical protein